MASLPFIKIRPKYTFKLILVSIAVLFFFCEFVLYWALPLTWIDQPDCPASQCKKILLVSDPQIIGPEWRRVFLLDLFAMWDSDRYLRRTFSQAVNYIKPDVIVFLGDLMDQGHIATDLEFESYKARLKKLFHLPNSLKTSKVIYTPGDNDIGGIEDILVLANVQRFDKAFNQTEECDFIDFIEFCKVNLMTSVMQESKFITSNIVRVALSHVPLTPKQSYFLKEVIKKIRPNVIFSGHVHTSSHYSAYESDVWSFKHSSITPAETNFRTYKFHEGLVHEIIVPTCSYRMGVYNMGYGAAFIDFKKQLVHYNVLWLPRRFTQIIVYTITIVPLFLALFVMAFRRTRPWRQVQWKTQTKFMRNCDTFNIY